MLGIFSVQHQKYNVAGILTVQTDMHLLKISLI